MENNEPPILYEDDFCIVINKPAGLMVHEDGRSHAPSLTDWILHRYPECAGVGEPMRLQNGEEIQRPGIVHRLDVETSGALLIARTQEAFLHLKAQFLQHTIQKTYHAFVYGVMRRDEGIIDRLIGRASTKHGPPRWSAERTAKGTLREATTAYRVLLRGKQHTYVEACPKTGRTHQIRVHLKAIQHPIVCDKLYAPKRPCDLGFSRLALHAHTIVFTNFSGEQQRIEAPLPEDFGKALSTLKSTSYGN